MHEGWKMFTEWKGRMKLRVAFLTLGCKVNFYETEKMKRQFEEAGHTVVAFGERADAYIINTCTVTNIADRKSRKMLHRARRQNPEAVVVAAGCYADSAKKKGEADESIDLFVSNEEKNAIVEKVAAALSGRGAVWQGGLSDFERECRMTEEAMPQKHTRAYLKVQDGCNQYCSYCIIPYVRGPLKSRGIEDAAVEAAGMAQQGIHEIVLTGIHLSSYGVDFSGGTHFVELGGRPLLSLLKEISGIRGIERIRLGSLEPRIITEEFVKELAGIPKLCPQFHLSLQSGCDGTLRRMNRHYTTGDYLKRLGILRGYFENPAITTDVIVGFPQETAEDFEATCAFVKKAAFARIHVFKYSRRHGTMADAMEGQVAEEEKARRSDVLLGTAAKLEEEYKRIFAGKREKVLFEEIVRIQGKEYLTGYNERYVRIGVPVKEGDIRRCNTIGSVQVSGCLAEGLMLGDFSSCP